MTETLKSVDPPPIDPGPDRDEEQELAAARELVRQAQAAGLSLTGADGLLKPLMKSVIEAALGEEMSEQLGDDKHAAAGRNHGSSSNGTWSKAVLTDAAGQVDIGAVALEPLATRRTRSLR